MTRILGLAAGLVLVGCNSMQVPTNASGDFPRKGSFVPATNINLLPGFSVTLEKLIYWGGVSAVAYYITDPLAPNWSITEAKFPQDQVYLSLQMKRYYAGGAGEARAVFHRRAKELMRTGGFASYEVLEYTEGLDSSVIGSQRVSEGVIALRRAAAPADDQGRTPPADSPPLSTTPSVEKPRS